MRTAWFRAEDALITEETFADSLQTTTTPIYQDVKPQEAGIHEINHFCLIVEQSNVNIRVNILTIPLMNTYAKFTKGPASYSSA